MDNIIGGTDLDLIGPFFSRSLLFLDELLEDEIDDEAINTAGPKKKDYTLSNKSFRSFICML